MFNRSTICKVANKLRKDGYTLSQACGVIDNISAIKAGVQAITGGFYADMMSGLRLKLSI